MKMKNKNTDIIFKTTSTISTPAYIAGVPLSTSHAVNNELFFVLDNLYEDGYLDNLSEDEIKYLVKYTCDVMDDTMEPEFYDREKISGYLGDYKVCTAIDNYDLGVTAFISDKIEKGFFEGKKLEDDVLVEDYLLESYTISPKKLSHDIVYNLGDNGAWKQLAYDTDINIWDIADIELEGKLDDLNNHIKTELNKIIEETKSKVVEKIKGEKDVK